MGHPDACEASRRTRLSIGLPVYNGERYLAQAIDSLLRQTFTDFTLIISDNGSTDATETICRSYAQRDARIQYHRSNEHRGAAWNFNRVFELSSSPYFKWAAYDDRCDPDFVKRCLYFLDHHPRNASAFPMRHWTLLGHYIRTVLRVPLPAGERLRCGWVVLNWTLLRVSLLARELAASHKARLPVAPSRTNAADNA